MELGEYTLEPLRKDEEFILYRGQHRSPKEVAPPSILLLAPVSQRPAPETVNKIEHEYSFRGELDPTWAVPPLALARHDQRTVLVLEDPGGEPLDRLIHGPMEIRQFLCIATGLATALSQFHKRSLIHKDLKPSNVLVDSVSGQVRLTGFGIASRLRREHQAPEPPQFIAGTLAYMAPEQTGRMNRSIDARSDLYAFGVTLYEMLTGILPFMASDPMEWVHFHMARSPEPPSERHRNVPGSVSAIIMKLLAKSPEERYQTAVGAENDLRHCLDQWNTHGRVDEFVIGQHDTPTQLLIPERLYGRAPEIEMLCAAFNRVVSSGRTELVLVSGYSGIGKSSVVNELQKVLVPPGGLFASGKFDQYKRDIPYSTLAQCFQGLILPLLGKSEGELRAWRNGLVEALEPNGRLIVDMLPELKLIIGEQPPVPELPPQDAQRRFHLVLRRCIGVFATPEHPLALFLDDLQWLDAATLELLQDLLTQSDVRHLMLIGAYRNNEVNSSHPLMRKLETIRHAGGKIQEIVLAPLTSGDLGRLLADSLHCSAEDVVPLAQLTHEKTAGNPFFSIQFISALTEEGLLKFDHGEARWSWDLNLIHAKGYTDNVVDLMVGKLNRLPLGTQNALEQLACVGSRADFATIQMVFQLPSERMHSQFWEAVRGGLIFRSEDSYRFLHDRVQEAAYSLIPQELRAEAHLRIGRLLAANTPLEKLEERIFEIVNQLNRGSHLITSAAERVRLAEMNFVAGRRAKASTAYESALNYLAAGRALLTEGSWENNYELTFSIECDMAECELLTADMGAAESRLSSLEQRAKGGHDIAIVTRLSLTLYTTLDRSDRSVEVCLEYLRRGGTDWSPHPTSDEVRREYDRISSFLGTRQVEELIDLPLMTDPDLLDAMDVLTEVVTPALFCDENLSSLVICRMLNLSLEHGNSDASCFAYVWFAIIAGPRFGSYKDGFRFGRLGYDLVEKRGLKRFAARTYMSFGDIVMPWTKHIQAGRDLVRRAFDAANEIGDVTFAAYSCDHLIKNLLAVGDPLSDVQREAENAIAFAEKVRFGLVIDHLSAQLGLVRTLRGLTPKFGSFNDGGFDELRFERRLANNPALAELECWYWVRKLQARFFAGDYASAIDAALNAQRQLWTSPSQFETAELTFYHALSLSASWDSTIRDQEHHYFEALGLHHRQLELWAENCPENFENRAALVGAEIARIEGRLLDAEQLYETAIRSAHANSFVQNEAVANELAARFYAARGFEKIANAYLRDAKYCYLRWGATGKVRQLDELYSQLRDENPTAGLSTTIGAPVEHLDLATIMKVSQAVSGEIVLEKLIDTLMRTAIEYGGAERGLLMLPQDDGMQLKAEATTSQAGVNVKLQDSSLTGAELPESLVRYVMRTHESVILDGASSRNPFSADTYIVQHRARSILCLPLINQAKLIGVLYLENNLTPDVFTPTRITVLKFLASQAAISLENTRLYGDLEQREAKIRRLVDANIMGIFIWNFEGKILEANDAFLRIVDYGRAELVSGQVRWMDLTPTDWRDRDLRALADLRELGTAQPYEKEFFQKNGSRVPVMIGAALFEPSGNQGVAFVLDLSEQKRAEDAVRRSEQRWQTAFENSAIGITLRDRTGRYVAANSAFQNMLGYTESELRHLTVMDLTYKEDLEICTRLMRELFEGKRQHYQIEKRYVRRDGTRLWVRNNVTPVAAMGDEEPFLFAVVEDITKRKQEEAARRYSDEKHRVVVETATDAVVCADDHGTILLANPATLRVFGYDPAELIGKPLTTLMPEYMRNLHEDGFQRYLATGHQHINWQRTEFTGLRKNGQEFPVEVSFGELFKDGQRIFTGFIRDISERKQAEEERERLRQAQADLAHINRVSTMGELTASLAHEIKQPIFAAVTNAETCLQWLEGDQPDLAEARQAASRLIKDATRASEIISRIGSLFKKDALPRELVDVNELIREMILLLQGEAARYSISIHGDLASDLPQIMADRVGFQQVLMNLMLNGIEAMKQIKTPGKLTIKSQQDDKRQIVVAVSDTGVGLPQEHPEQIFGPFFTTKAQGIGMGLPIIRSIIASHRGRLWAVPNAGPGATFQFTLPIEVSAKQTA